MKAGLRIADPATVWLGAALTLEGLLFAFDAGYSRSISAGHGVIPAEFRTQAMFAAPALGVGWLVARLGLARLRRLAQAIWFATLALLLAALASPLRSEMNGAFRWLKLGPIQIQPAEMAKLAAVLYLAAVFADRKAWPKRRPRFDGFARWLDGVAVPALKRWLPGLWLALGIFLIEREPDLGTGLVIGAIGFAVAMLGGARWTTLLAAVGIACLGVTWTLYSQPYRLQRIENHERRWEPGLIDSEGYQTVQSEIAMASGHIFGTGIGGGLAKTKLPAATTDFMLATVAEETGFVGTAITLAALAALVFRLLWRASKARDQFGGLLLGGVATWLAVQGSVNLLQANGTLPPIGIPFPFLSSGGSSLIALWAAIGACETVPLPGAPARPESPDGFAIVQQEDAHAAGHDRRRHRRTRISRR